MNITWTITNMKRQPSDGLVTEVFWGADAEDGEPTASYYGKTVFERDESFVPFEELTKEQVLEWVKATLDVEAIEAKLAADIAAQQTPAILSGTPWGN